MAVNDDHFEAQQDRANNKTRAKSFGVSVAIAYFKMFDEHPEYRGVNFVWPDTLRKILPEHTDMHCDMNLITCKKTAVKAAKVKLEELINEAKGKRRKL